MNKKARLEIYKLNMHVIEQSTRVLLEMKKSWWPGMVDYMIMQNRLSLVAKVFPFSCIFYLAISQKRKYILINIYIQIL